LSRPRFLALIALKSPEARLFYARQAAAGQLGVRALRDLISRKAFERAAIADAQNAPDSPVPKGAFKDPDLF
jgi:predicted nuclease of restriction endonuclease-like (RecB) superfamily